MVNSREQAAREAVEILFSGIRERRRHNIPISISDALKDSALKIYNAGYNAGCEHEAKRLLKYYKEWYELIKDGHTEAEGLYCVIADLEVSLKEANPPKEESE